MLYVFYHNKKEKRKIQDLSPAAEGPAPALRSRSLRMEGDPQVVQLGDMAAQLN